MSNERQDPQAVDNELAAMRVGYPQAGSESESVEDRMSAELDTSVVETGWLPLMRQWLVDAVEADAPEPNAMTLSTVDDGGRPASRTVLCKGLSEDGVLFFTNYGSDKARHLDAHPYASANFTWLTLARQVIVRGATERVSAQLTQEYWRTRPRGSQLGAWASSQSRPIDSRADLDEQLREVAARFGVDGEIPVPPNWGGILIRPESVEFWQGRANRMHNRVRTSLVDGHWSAVRLQP
ncbi:pyridoxamine 5'-phosphate oxidase [Rhodococcus erythropolis]|uniref:pyridoxamine 5'-phosphate oxidase n=1 Tax=Rhodococcus erythropolis TaxID=1833 RepID=UPI0022B5D474|nr:pyridoxamine 5'-phosphate oxidase [Rhodococcus erythropolis]MCZ4565625.1 pyridoxamine 5'-phosphate oxidase [Rhodococcus erythropolis]